MTKLRRATDGYGGKCMMHWCPGCDEAHGIYYERGTGTGPVWTFNRDMESPTFGPSVRISDERGTVCHYFLVAGMIQFCGDCRHALSGKTVPLPDWPYADGEYSGIDDNGKEP
jgi:hypothetical protein